MLYKNNNAQDCLIKYSLSGFVFNKNELNRDIKDNVLTMKPKNEIIVLVNEIVEKKGELLDFDISVT